MKIDCYLIRDHATATCVTIDLHEINFVHRIIFSSLRNSGGDAKKYHYLAFSNNLDISASDTLEDVTATTASYKIINKRFFSPRCLELDLEMIHG